MLNGNRLKCMLMFLSAATLLLVASRQAVSEPIFPPPPPLVVGTCLGASPYTTIQSAVTAAPSGGTVLVCPGTYPEQVTISKPLTLKGAQVGNHDAAVIASPGGGLVANATTLHSGISVYAQVLVQDTTEVNISNLTVDGSGNGISACNDYFPGFYYQNASGSVNSVAARSQTATCSFGFGFYAETGGSVTAEVAVLNSSFHSFNGSGIIVNRPGTKGTIVGNSVAGIGLADTTYEEGIQLGYGATGKVEGNTVVDNVSPNTTIGPDAGILIYAGSGAVVANNIVGNSNYGIELLSDPVEGPADHTTVVGNTILATHNAGATSDVGDAIDVCSNSNVIMGNTIFSSDESGIHLDGTCTSTGNNNVVKQNTINEACAGILEDTGTAGNKIGFGNLFFNDVNTILSADGCYPGVFPDPPPTGTGGAVHSQLHPY